MWKKPYEDCEAAEISEEEGANMAAAGTMQHNHTAHHRTKLIVSDK